MEIVASHLSSRLESVSDTPVAAPPDASAVQQFAALMQAPAPDAVAAAAPVAASTGDSAVSASAPENLGDKMLQGMQKMSTEFNQNWTRVSEMLNSGNSAMDLPQMFSFQLHLAQASLQYDVATKGISRSTQNFEQLVRMQ